MSYNYFTNNFVILILKIELDQLDFHCNILIPITEYFLKFFNKVTDEMLSGLILRTRNVLQLKSYENTKNLNHYLNFHTLLLGVFSKMIKKSGKIFFI